MAQQEEGWPLGLQPLNERVGLPLSRRVNGDFSGSISFNTLHTASPVSSTDSSSDLDTESTGSFFHDRSITLGSLIGASLKTSKSSRRVKKVENKKSNKTWMFSLCSRDTTDAPNVNNINSNAPSLGQFLAVERRAGNGCRRNVNVDSHSYGIYGAVMESNPLFVNGQVAPPRITECYEQADCDGTRRNGEIEHEDEGPVRFSWICGHLS
ncbi:hypothetical protein M5689_022103 [Euphorbia peplus]|nr:hypothetical protein M5689_022103 [Euphorbia peplus]